MDHDMSEKTPQPMMQAGSGPPPEAPIKRMERQLAEARGTLAAVRASAVLSVCRIHRGHRDRCDRPACVLGRGILAILEGE